MATASKDLARLRAIPLFAGLDDDALHRVADAAADFEVPPGHVLVQPQYPAAGLFVIEDGTVLVEKSGRTIQIGAGETVGELALLDPGGLRSARVQASTDVRGLAIERSEFTRLLSDEPAIAIALLQILARRLAAD